MIVLSGLQGGGGGHHGGHRHGHHHGHHRYYGGGYGTAPGNFYYGDFWPYYYDDYAYTPTCPLLYAPVLGYDGKIYDNECYAMAAGTDVLRALKPGDVVEKPGVSGNLAGAMSKAGFGAAVGFGAVSLVKLLFGR